MLSAYLAAVLSAATPMPTELSPTIPLTAVPSPVIAIIARSASTNAASSTIAVARDGTLTVRNAASAWSGHVSRALAARLYTDLAHAGSLGALPFGHCSKSMSFGTTTVIAFAGQQSPDLQCAQNEIERALAADANGISELIDRCRRP